MAEVTIRFARNVDGWRKGDEVTVERDKVVDKMITRGFVKVVATTELSEPALNASRADWVDYVEQQGYKVWPRATRRRIIDDWESVKRGAPLSVLGEVKNDAGSSADASTGAADVEAADDAAEAVDD